MVQAKLPNKKPFFLGLSNIMAHNFILCTRKNTNRMHNPETRSNMFDMIRCHGVPTQHNPHSSHKREIKLVLHYTTPNDNSTSNNV